MSSPTNTAEMMALSSRSQENLVPAAEEARPHTFLSLAPTTSASYPAATKTPVQEPTIPAQQTTSAAVDVVVPELVKTRRSSSLSSDGSGSGSAAKGRFLKLGPVHGGEGDGMGDWSEDVIA